MASPTDVRPLTPAHRRGVSEGGSPALRRGLRGGGRSRQLCLCPGMGEVEEPPPEMQDLGTRKNSGEEEVVTCSPFQRSTSSGFCKAGAFSFFLLEFFTWELLLFFSGVFVPNSWRNTSAQGRLNVTSQTPGTLLCALLGAFRR